MKRLTPAEYVISVFGGVRATAKAIGRTPSCITKWKKPKKLKGCGGRVPSIAQGLILTLAVKRNLPITAEDLLCGRETG